tara:strand:+ start:121 stop:534 length:414 start_codon:yes stop_codon:yes gene_type:complete
MKIAEALKALENSWSREEVLIKLKKGEDSEKIINDFFKNKNKEIEILTNFINPKNKFLLNEIEKISTIESKLINKIKNFSIDKIQLSKKELDQELILQTKKKPQQKIGMFMMKWSNKFIFISLLVISAIALTKQAWA